MRIFEIDTTNIIDWESFHAYFQNLFGFPSQYGHNMIDWIDCMAALDDPNTGMTKTNIPQGETVVLRLTNFQSFKKNCRELLDVLLECTAYINKQNIERGIKTMIALSYG